jgi:hypothetical protein
MKLFLGLLTSHHLRRLKRLVRSIQEANHEPNVDLNPVIVVNTLNDSYYQEVLTEGFPYPVVRTESNGRPGKGKNSVAELFLQSDCDFMTQIDGDDLFYPTYLQSLWQHVKRYPSIDVLGLIPADFIKVEKPTAGHIFAVGDLWASVWGTSLGTPYPNGGPGRGEWLDQLLPKSQDFTILQSKKSAKFKIDEHIAVGEDHLYTMKLLSEHQKGTINYFQSMSSDIYLIDSTTENSVQKQFPQLEWVDELKQKGLMYLNDWRSNFGELPVVYHELLMNQWEKQEWIIKWQKELYLDA